MASPVLDPNGSPLALVSMSAEEKIGLPSYSNVTLSGSVSRWVEDTPEAILEGLVECVEAVETIIAKERVSVIEMAKVK